MARSKAFHAMKMDIRVRRGRAWYAVGEAIGRGIVNPIKPSWKIVNALFYRDILHKARLWTGLSGHGGVGPRESVEGVDIETRFLPGGIKPSLLTFEFDIIAIYPFSLLLWRM